MIGSFASGKCPEWFHRLAATAALFPVASIIACSGSVANNGGPLMRLDASVGEATAGGDGPAESIGQGGDGGSSVSEGNAPPADVSVDVGTGDVSVDVGATDVWIDAGAVDASIDAGALDVAMPEGGSVTTTDGAALADTFVHAQLGRSTDANFNNLCNQSSFRDVLDIGTATGNCDPTTGVCMGSGVQRVPDGSTQSGAATVHVQCSVTGGFDLSLSASLGGMLGGTLQIAGHVDGTGVGSNIYGVLIVPFWGGTYSSNNCTITAMYNGGSVPTSPPVAPGRIWAHLSCPAMPNMSGMVRQLMDGTQVTETCDGEADFIFENCSQ